MAQFDPVAFKAGTREQWNSVAERWNAWGPVIKRWLGPSTDAMLDMAKVTKGSRVLHVAARSGRGVVRTIQRVVPQGYVLMTNLAENLIELARKNMAKAGIANVEARVMDGKTLDLPAESFDAALSRVGLIFFPDQERSVREQMAALKPGGYVGAVVYAPGEECRFFSDPVAIIRRHAALPPPLPTGGLRAPAP